MPGKRLFLAVFVLIMTVCYITACLPLEPSVPDTDETDIDEDGDDTDPDENDNENPPTENNPMLKLTASAGSGSAYDLIRVNGFDYETPDQTVLGGTGGHVEFGPHILQQYDETLGKNVFAFVMHHAVDRNATGDWRRQRVEIKIDHRNNIDNPGRDFCGLPGADESRSFIHRWKFKLPDDFVVSSSFTHLHQIKNEGGADSAQPIVVLTARIANGVNRMQLAYYAPGTSSPTNWINDNNHLLADYLGQWVQCEETITYSSDTAIAAYSIKITRISDNRVLMNYTAAPNSIITWREGQTHGRPKFGLYRTIFSGNNPGNFTEPASANLIPGLKDETILFADFEIVRLK